MLSLFSNYTWGSFSRAEMHTGHQQWRQNWVLSCVDVNSPKGASLYILPAEAYMDALFEKGTKCHVLS